MGKYCCFCCPAFDYAEKSLDDLCPTCDRTYGFPLSDAPAAVRDYRIEKTLGRGFYAATYVAERGPLNAKSVLKVSPTSVYDFFSKNFEDECKTHMEVALGTEHIVGIRDMFHDEVAFGTTVAPCHIAELEFVEGRLLADYLKPEAELSAKAVAQIAIDLFRIRDELQKKNVNHNDLHAENIIVASLAPDARRANAIHDGIRAVAIDLGSVSDGSKSDSTQSRLGDLHWIATHLDKLVGKLLHDPDTIPDVGNRLASALQLILQSISPRPQHQRTPGSPDFIEQIEDAYHRVTRPWRPWREPLSLKAFNASYNAQTMDAWHVPRLLVDPDGQWSNNISSPGPQVITGMRGCGKTMLLRALQFHARAAQGEAEAPSDVLARIRDDNYVGIFVSAQRLLDSLGEKPKKKRDPFARLLVAYGVEAVRATQHLRDVDEKTVATLGYKELAAAIAGCLAGASDLLDVTSESELEARLSGLLIALSRKDHEYSLTVHPNVAFPMLAQSLRRCAEIWHTARVLFLLDDVSTRYLTPLGIEELLSALLFQDPLCAFKLTSEAQTIEPSLKSPGENHPARIGRDLSVFDLGAEVYGKIKKRTEGGGRDLVERILAQRAKYFASHPTAGPRELLGETSLEAIATRIGETAKDSRGRKGVYHGITALAGMCVGDIGDVISLYELILKSAAGGTFPIDPEIQSECFQDFCARRLYDLNRRGGFLKDIAKTFAEASHELLVKSYKGPGSSGGKRRIRQYLSLYVRITTGDLEKQTERLRELIDAGVFVFAGGSNVPRTKTRDGNPTQQFKLTYRKIYGLVNFIGLSERDRFELSGAALEDWLAHPSQGKAILLRNLEREEGSNGGKGTGDESVNEVATGAVVGKTRPGSRGARGTEQISLFGARVPDLLSQEPRANQPANARFVESKKPTVRLLAPQEFARVPIDCAIVGLGFEERTLESVRRLCSVTNPSRAVLVEYQEPGNGDEIKAILTPRIPSYSSLDYSGIIDKGLPEPDGYTVVDITGLAKPVIFHAVRDQLRRRRRVWVWHTEATGYYPLDGDLDRVFEVDADRNVHALLEALHGVLTGERGPYVSDKLLQSDADETRQRVLCAPSSPKHERLLSLLDNREYDRVEIVAPKKDTPRGKLARIAAEVAARNNANSNITHIDSNDLDGFLAFVIDKYKCWYIDGGLNFEFGLTGSKLQAVACAAASAAFKVSQAWYLRPQEFDPDRFTRGVGETRCWEIALP